MCSQMVFQPGVGLRRAIAKLEGRDREDEQTGLTGSGTGRATSTSTSTSAAVAVQVTFARSCDPIRQRHSARADALGYVSRSRRRAGDTHLLQRLHGPAPVGVGYPPNSVRRSRRKETACQKEVSPAIQPRPRTPSLGRRAFVRHVVFDRPRRAPGASRLRGDRGIRFPSSGKEGGLWVEEPCVTQGPPLFLSGPASGRNATGPGRDAPGACRRF